MGKKFFGSALIAIGALIVLAFSGRNIPLLDGYADRYFNDTTTEAALAYASVRGVNAVISVLKESQIEISPAGVGLNIAAGQILDPIDDMTERLSAVLVTALVSLGLQKLLMEIGQTVPLGCLSALLLLLILPIWLPRLKNLGITGLLVRISAIMVILRIILPISSLLNDSLYEHLLQEEIVAAKQQLTTLSAGGDNLVGFTDLKGSGIVSSFSQTARQKLEDAKELYERISQHGDEIIGALLKLTTLYVSLFILQVIVIPIGVLWLLVKLVNGLFNSIGAASQRSTIYRSEAGHTLLTSSAEQSHDPKV